MNTIYYELDAEGRAAYESGRIDSAYAFWSTRTFARKLADERWPLPRS